MTAFLLLPAGAAIADTVTTTSCSIEKSIDPHNNQFTCNYGYTLDAHIKRLNDALKARLDELSSPTLIPYRRYVLQTEAAQIQKELAQPEASYDEFLRSLDVLVAQSRAHAAGDSADRLDIAIANLEAGKIELAENGFKGVRDDQQKGIDLGDQQAIDEAARADFELGRIAFGQADFATAKRLLKEANALVPFHKSYRDLYLNLVATTYDFQEALRLDRENLTRVDVLSGETTPAHAEALKLIAGDEVNLRAYKDADHDFQSALKVFHDKGDLKGEAEIYSNLATIADQVGGATSGQQYAQLAVDSADEAKAEQDVSRTAGPPISPTELARYRLNLATYKIRDRQWSEAEQLVRAALQLDDEVPPGDSVEGRFFALEALASIQMKTGICDQASATLDRAGDVIGSQNSPMAVMLARDRRIVAGCQPVKP